MATDAATKTMTSTPRERTVIEHIPQAHRLEFIDRAAAGDYEHFAGEWIALFVAFGEFHSGHEAVVKFLVTPLQEQRHAAVAQGNGESREQPAVNHIT